MTALLLAGLFISAGDIPPDALIVDARPAARYRESHVPNAVHINWKKYRDGWGRTGRLHEDVDQLAARLAQAGVDADRPVIVYDDAREGWGEAGRVAWMISYLGHDDVRILDGGFEAWKAGTPTQAAKPGNFQATPRSSWRAAIDDLEDPEVIVLDVRTREEFEGARPYLSKRGGHVPGAKHLYWKDMLDEDGYRRAELKTLLEPLGIEPDTKIITYCTGGVRSAEALFLLRAAGYNNVRNYDGSWFEWSADKSREVEH